MAVVLEDPRQRVAVGGVPAAGRDQRPGRDWPKRTRPGSALGGLGAAGAEALPGVEDRAQRAPMPAVRQPQVHEPGPGDLASLELVAKHVG